MRLLQEGGVKKFQCFDDFKIVQDVGGKFSRFGDEEVLYVNQASGSVFVFMEGGARLLATSKYWDQDPTYATTGMGTLHSLASCSK